ncbi:hypothetical protein ACTMTU_14360 [Streptomyces sp. OZ13]|uniref:hypothetical protein n=1 Tax=Streptomyces sp. OZ13 TaxID=3452210 RepID=UPI003F8C7E5A
MGDIAKGVLGGGWSLVVGWVLPAALNLAVFLFAVAPSLRGTALMERIRPESSANTALLLLVASVMFGLLLNSLQAPLYRLLEGYLLWPRRAYDRGCRIQRARRQRIADRIAGAGTRAPIQAALLQERLARYPAADEQIAPTRLGNAIRRFEEYGYDRYRLDTQVLWNELTGTAPKELGRQVDTARSSADFFVALLYGHVVIAAAALASLPFEGADVPLLAVTATVLTVLIPAWYRAAVTATDEWAAAVRALVNAGRKPLADALGLVLPQELGKEREMWLLVTRMSRRPYRPAADTALAPYRAAPAQPGCCCTPPPTAP